MDKLLAWFVSKNFLSVRSMMLYIAVWMTFDATHWGARFAETSHLTGADLSLVIAAVTLPITGFTGFVYKFYSDSRQSGQDAV